MALKFGKKNVGIDLGTSNTLLYIEDQGIVINEPSFIAKNATDGTLLAVGQAAAEMFEKNPPTISVIRPLRKGVISDLEGTISMIKYFLSVAYANRSGHPMAVIGVPSGVTEVERRAVKDAAQSAGAGTVYVVDETIAAAIGAGLPVYEAPGTMVVDLGGGTVDVATISLGKPNASRSTTYAGDAMNEAIKNMISTKYHFRISEADAQTVKEQVGSADVKKSKKLGSITVRGIDQATSLPSMLDVSAEDVAIALKGPLTYILDAIQSTLEDSLPELVSDIVDRGIILTGGGAQLHDLDTFIADAVHVPVFVAADPANSVANGLGEILKQPNLKLK